MIKLTTTHLRERRKFFHLTITFSIFKIEFYKMRKNTYISFVIKKGFE